MLWPGWVFVDNTEPNSANALCKSNLILRLYFGNLRKLLSANVVLRNLNYLRNLIVVVTLLSLPKTC